MPIPKKIHQVWVGKNPMPDLWMDSIKGFCSTFGQEYQLWTEKSIKELDFSQVKGLQRLQDSFEGNTQLCGRADLIRLVAIEKQGGIQIDADSVILKPEKLDHFFETQKASAFFGWEEIDPKKDQGIEVPQKRLVLNGVIGATPHHPFIRRLLKEVVPQAESRKHPDVWTRTGPLFVTDIYHKVKDQQKDIKVQPMKQFQAADWHGITDPFFHTKMRVPKESMMFQQGYSTNHYWKLFKKREENAKSGLHATLTVRATRKAKKGRQSTKRRRT